MGEISLPILLDLLFLLIFPLITGLLALKLRLPAIIGYIVGGIILGIILFGKIPEAILSEFASFGIILLLFTVGLEVKIENLKKFGHFVILGGLAQIIITAIAIFFLSLLFNFTFIESLFIGFSFALSSTAVVAKLIQEKGEENSLLGGLIIGILVLQDLAVIPLLILFSSFKEGFTETLFLQNLIWGLSKSVFVLITVFWLGKNFIPLIFDKLADFSRELLNLLTIFIILATIYLFSFVGLSATLAAFIAGVLIGQTTQHYHIFSQIKPLRDLFAILFFVFLGASLKIPLIAAVLPKILVFSLLLILLKFTVVLVIFLVYKFHTRTSFAIAIYLSQVGEFSFIIMNQGFTQKVISYETYLFAIASVLLTIALTPIFISNIDSLYLKIKDLLKTKSPKLARYITRSVDQKIPHIEVLKIKDHVVICGFGRVGRYVGKALQMNEIPFLAIDYDFYIIQKAKEQGINAIYGDSSEMDILDYAEVENARALVCAVPRDKTQEAIIINAKKLNPGIKIYTRVHKEEDQERMKKLGAEVVVQPEFEASLTIIKQILKHLKLPETKIHHEFEQLKKEHDFS